MRVASRPTAHFSQATKHIHISIKVHATQAAWGNIVYVARALNDDTTTRLILRELQDAYDGRHTIVDAIHRLHLLGHDPAPLPYTNPVGMEIVKQAGVPVSQAPL